MKANELRIGNYFDDFGTIRQVSPAIIEDVWISERTWCKHIPLTEEWLVKFGFEKQDNNWNRLCICNDWSYFYWEKLAGLELSINKHSVMLPHIKYIHQLQNLYFALTGEELTIKE